MLLHKLKLQNKMSKSNDVKLKAVLFDCWDTVIKFGAPEKHFPKGIYNNFLDEDSKKKVSLEKFLEVVDKFYKEYFSQKTYELPISTIYNCILSKLNLKLIDGFNIKSVCEILGRGFTPEPIDYVPELVKTIRQHGLYTAIMSNTIHSFDMTYYNITKCYEGKFLFDKLVVSSELGVKKPYKEFFLSAIGTMNLKPEECVYVGDSIIADVYGSYNAGFRKPVHFNWKGLSFEDLNSYDENLILKKDKYYDIKSYLELIELIKENKL